MTRCKHCGLSISIKPERSKSYTHDEGEHKGKHRCAIEPYGYNAEPIGTACSNYPNRCNGYSEQHVGYDGDKFVERT